MPNLEILNQNLEFLEHVDPELFRTVLDHLHTKRLEFVKSTSGLWNLKSTGPKEVFFLHSQDDPIKEAYDSIKDFPVDNQLLKTVFIFGCGLGYYYDVLKTWLSENRHRSLVFIENDPAIFAILLQTDRGSEILRNPQIHFFFLKNNQPGLQKLEEIVKLFIPYPIHIITLPAYQIHKTAITNLLRELIWGIWSQWSGMAMEFLTFSKDFIPNFLNNLYILEDAYHGNQLYGKFKNIPAIICGAGPSLNNNIQLLKGLQHKAVIFAGSSALNALSGEHIQPHFGVYLDAYERVYERSLGTQAFTLPTFLTCRVHYKLPQAMNAPKLYINGTTNYPILSWVEEKLGIPKEPMSEGLSVICLTTQIATFLGCNPIIYVGLDLAYTNQERYSSHIREGALPRSEQVHLDNSITKQDIFNHTIQTNVDWLAESEWLQSFIKQHPNTQFINATEGGLGIKGVANTALNNVIEKHCKHSYPIKDQIFSEFIQHHFETIDKKKIHRVLKQFLSSLKRCYKGYSRIVKYLEKQRKKIEKSDDTIDLKHSKTIKQLEDQIMQETAYQNFLKQHQHISNLTSQKNNLLNRYLDNEFITQKMRLMLQWKQMSNHYSLLQKATNNFIINIKEHLEKK